jgi:hypothetical protein
MTVLSPRTDIEVRLIGGARRDNGTDAMELRDVLGKLDRVRVGQIQPCKRSLWSPNTRIK